ncbi:TRAP transporter large permease subunit, partial [Chloroflexota bacterium]
MIELGLWTTVLLLAIVLLICIGSGMRIGLVMGLVGILMMVFLLGGKIKLASLGILQYNITADNYALVSLPLFIFMGYLILHIGLADRLFAGSTPMVGFIPGGLLHANIFCCAIFSAMCGSSLATAATIGAIAIPKEIDELKYPRRSVVGSLAAGGTLGILIPPSITFICYGVFVGTSIGQLFMAGLLPGIILAGIFMSYIFMAAIIRPSTAGERIGFSLKNIFLGFGKMWPTFLIILLVLGSIFLGITTPTE